MAIFDSVASHIEQRDGQIYLAGQSISRIVEQTGTPVYLYDTSVLKWRHDLLRKFLPKEIKITYAVKANPNIDVIRELNKLYDGVDLASQGEMERCLLASVEPENMSFAGPGKSIEELEFAIKNKIGSLSVESERELEHIENICRKNNLKANVMIRVNPAFELARSGLKMGGGPKQFGIDSERVENVIKQLENSEYIQFKGIHIFSGTQNLNAESIVEAFQKILEYTTELQANISIPVSTLNLGGGFGIPYFLGDKELDLEFLGSEIQKLVDTFSPKLPQTQFKIELGRYIVGEAGLYASRIRYKKISRGTTFLVLDGGMHQHLPASGNISLSPIRRQMQLTVANKLNAATEKVHVVGPLCTPLDTFGMNVELPAAEEGDIVVVYNSGAYGYSISPLNFLSHPLPKEVLV